MEINGDDSFRIRSYRNAAEAIEGNPQQIADIISEPKKVLAIPGIGKGMLQNLQEIFREGSSSSTQSCSRSITPRCSISCRYKAWAQVHRPNLDRIQGLRHRWPRETSSGRQTPHASTHERKDRAEDTQVHRRLSQHLRTLLLDEPIKVAQKLIEHLAKLPGVEKITPAGSLRRGRETVGDLDILITGDCCTRPRSATQSSRRFSDSPA